MGEKDEQWLVDTAYSTETVTGGAPEVTEHGDLVFSNGAVFASNSWNYAVPKGK